MTKSIDIFNKPSDINTLEDVKNFQRYIMLVKEVNYHPDTDFEDYICYSTGEPSFSYKENELYNLLNNRCFEVCEHLKDDEEIYRISCQVLDELYKTRNNG